MKAFPDVVATARALTEAALTDHGTKPRRLESYCGCGPFTYFIQYGENGPIKIGRASDVERRRTELQPGCPYDLIIVATTTAYSERSVHEFFGDERIRGEWFQPSERLLEFVAYLRATA